MLIKRFMCVVHVIDSIVLIDLIVFNNTVLAFALIAWMFVCGLHLMLQLEIGFQLISYFRFLGFEI